MSCIVEGVGIDNPGNPFQTIFSMITNGSEDRIACTVMPLYKFML